MSPELRARLAATPMAFFRFVNEAWTRQVCEAFQSAMRGQLPTARLHGDAHVEQYAVTATARGLDDFDDSARGPAVIDIVRFLGSLELAAAQRRMDSVSARDDRCVPGWLSSWPRNPVLLAARPRGRGADASRHREVAGSVPLVDRFAHAAPGCGGTGQGGTRFGARVVAVASKADPAFTPAFMALKRVGWLRMGIGSALTPKLLIRIEGPTRGARRRRRAGGEADAGGFEATPV